MSDITLMSFGPECSGMRYDGSTLGGEGYDNALKCSGVDNFTGVFHSVVGGEVGAVQVGQQCRNVTLRAHRWTLRGSKGFSIQGGSEGTRIDGWVIGRGLEADIELGCDLRGPKTRGTHLNLRRVAGRPLLVKVGNAEAPTFEPGSGPYEFTFPSPKLGPLHAIIIWGLMILRRVGYSQ